MFCVYVCVQTCENAIVKCYLTSLRSPGDVIYFIVEKFARSDRHSHVAVLRVLEEGVVSHGRVVPPDGAHLLPEYVSPPSKTT